jgi:transposase
LAQDWAIDLWALDEVHFCQHGSRCRMWIPWEEDDPVLWHYPGRKSVGYFGAVRLRDGRGLFQKEEGMFNGVTFWSFLQQLRTVSAQSGRRVVVISDNAKYHHACLHKEWRQQQAPHFALDYLPPYSPELNPIERIWKRTRRKCVHNVYFPRLQALIEKVDHQFVQWSEPNDELARLCRM